MNGGLTLVAGTLGGGKSMYAAERIFWHLYDGGEVFTNIEMNPDAIEREMAERGRQFEPSRLHQLGNGSLRGFEGRLKRGTKECQVLVALDEAHLEWNSRDFVQSRKDQDKEMLSFITLVRKLDIDLLMITQNPEDIDKQIRKKGALLVMNSNLKRTRFLGLIPCPFPVFQRTVYDVSVGNKKPRFLSVNFFLRPRWVCRIYNSDALLGTKAGAFAGLEVSRRQSLKTVAIKQSLAPECLGVLACLLVFV